MVRAYFSFSVVPVSKLKPLAMSIRALVAGGLAMSAGIARAELPVPTNPASLATLGAATAVTQGNTMTITQTTDKAILDWRSFNIDAQSAVHFDQKLGPSSVALNNIHQADPSRILGELSANGQIYLVNQNGFVFGKDSVVNVNSLIATTLNISEDTLKNGLVQAFDLNKSTSHAKSAALSATDANGNPTTQAITLTHSDGQPLLDQKGRPVLISIHKGAQISTNGAGGRILMAGPSIVNAGTIQANDGQVILAASKDKVYLQPAPSDSGVRGLLVEVGKGGEVSNIGQVIAERGNASLIGFYVTQQGRVSTTTSVNLNGSVRLLAREGFGVSSGGTLLPASTTRAQNVDGLGTSATVDLGKGSLTSVELDADKTTTAVDAQSQPRSQIEISAHKIVARPDSVIRAKSGVVRLSALDNPQDNPTKPALKGNARIYLDKGARIDVSGMDVVRAMESNVLQVELRNNELRDAPLQKNGVLHGATVTVDIRDVDGNGKIPIADVKGALDRIARNVDERNTAGGTITLASSGEVIAKQGSVLDFSGGTVRYQDGYLQTTKLLSNGQIYDIGKADPLRHYDKILSLLPGLKVFQKGYIEGKDGGNLNIAAFSALLDGLLDGKTATGEFQRTVASATPGHTQLPGGSSLSIDLTGGGASNKQNVVFVQHAASALGSADPLPTRPGTPNQTTDLLLDPSLFANGGIRNVAITTNGTLDIAAGAQLTLPAFGKLDASALGFNLAGSIVAPSGNIRLTPSSPAPSAITLGQNALIDVRGLWINDWLDSQRGAPLQALVIDGGSVKLVSEQGNVTLKQGSRILAGGGAWRQGNGKVQAGKGGTIELVSQTSVPAGTPSSLVLDPTAQLSAWALENGGKLTLRSNEVVIGQDSAVPSRPGSPHKPLLLHPEFFTRGGFAGYDIGSNVYGVTVADGAQVKLLQRNLLLPLNSLSVASGRRLDEFSSVATLPDVVRHAASLKLSFAEILTQNFTESLKIGTGAAIRTDPKGSVSLNSDTSILVDGHIDTPAGNIDINLTLPRNDKGFNAKQAIWLGANSRLSARGIFKTTPNALGLIQGDVLDGGDVSIAANRGYIVSQAGSSIDVSGTAARLDFLESTGANSALRRVSRTIGSTGGTINLAAGEGILADGTFAAHAGGAGVSGGSLSVELNGGLRAKPAADSIISPFPDDNQSLTQPKTIKISAVSNTVVPAGLKPGDAISSNNFSGQVLLKQNRINEAGFASIKLKTDAFDEKAKYVGSVLFDGDVTLRAARQIVLDTPTLAWMGSAGDKGLVRLDTAHAVLGSTQSRVDAQNSLTSTLAPKAITGRAQFAVGPSLFLPQNQTNAYSPAYSNAGIDLVGGLSFNGFGQVGLNSRGDIRAIGILGVSNAKNYLGELKFAGDLSMKADQIYPTTLSDYKITATGTGDQTVKFLGTGESPAPVLSAGGQLSVASPFIEQQGILRAPMGKLELNASKTLTLADKSITSVSANSLTIPFGRVSGGQNWLYPLNAAGTRNVVIDAPPEKQIVLSGKDVKLEQGAKVDLKGGGDLYAYEFIPGPGGSVDVLDPTDSSFSTKFAVIPGIHGISTPYDPAEFPTSGIQTGDSVYLSASAGLAEGWYTLLPAHYALLPGAFLVTPQAHTQDMAPGQTITRLDGAPIVAGRYGVANTGIADARWQGFTVESGAVARTRTEYKDYGANSFFTAKAASEGAATPALPQDAGNLTLAATASLSLRAILDGTPVANGRRGQVDIDGDNLSIAGSASDFKLGSVGLLASDLNNLNAPSLLVGGRRSRDKNGVHISVGAKNIEVLGGASLKGQEILLAAQEQLKLDTGATVESNGRTGTAGETIRVANRPASGPAINSDGAFLRVSSSGQANVVREKAVTGSKGMLIVESGARIKADGSALLDSTKDTRFAGDIIMQGGSLALKSSKISIGNAPANTSGLVLADAQFTLDELKLSSATDLNLYGGVNFNTQQLVIDAASINGFGNAGTVSSISANKLIKLSNSGATSSSSGNGTGSLSLIAPEIELGAGSYAIKGFDNVTLDASAGSVQGVSDAQASSKLTVTGDLTLKAGRIAGNSGSTTVLDASGHDIAIQGGAAPTGETALGASWQLIGDAIVSQGGRFDLPSGILKLDALNGDVTLGNSTAIDVSGRSLRFDNITQYASAGTVAATSRNGDVNLADTATINLSGAAAANTQGGDAGLLRVSAEQGTFAWNGQIAAQAATTAVQGRINLDVASLGDFSVLSGKLGQAGFTEQVTLRQRQDDVGIADKLTAHHFDLSADQGQVTISSTIDASGAKAGDIAIYGRNGVSLSNTGKLLAKATASGQRGGSVTLDSIHRDDNGSGLLTLATGSLIDVSGANGDPSGAIHLRTGRDELAQTQLDGALQGFDKSRSALEATRVYTGVSDITASEIGQWQSDTAAFMNTQQGQQSTSPLGILPGIEARSSGNLTLVDTWDFEEGSWSSVNNAWESVWRYADANGDQTLPGFLTLRAGDDLNINASLTDAFATTPLPDGDPAYRIQDLLQAGRSWSYRLIAGGSVNLAPSYQDANAIDPSQMNPQVKVRTGTGAIALDAGGSIRFIADANNPQAAATVYTMGRPAEYTVVDLLNGNIPLPTALRQGANESTDDYLSRLSLHPEELNTWLRYGFRNVSDGYPQFLAEFPTQGGTVSLNAGADIDGIQTGQSLTDWLVKSGFWDTGNQSAFNQSTAWGIGVSGKILGDLYVSDADGNAIFLTGNRFFNQNVGALGGGDVAIQAGGNVNDLTVALPSTGKPLGKVDTQGRWLSNATVVNGGGDLQITAGDNINGGEYYVGRGTGQFRATGNIKDASNGLGPILEVGDAQLFLQARQDVSLGAALNPTLLPQKTWADPSAIADTVFFTYGDASAIELASTGGSIVLENDGETASSLKNEGSRSAYSVLPGTLRATTYSGNIRIENSMTLFPSPLGQLQLLANQSIGADQRGDMTVNVSDADKTLLPSVRATAPDAEQVGLQLLTHAVTPVHQGQHTKSSIITRLGDIAFAGLPAVNWLLPMASEFSAGRDIRNLNLVGQNLATTDITRVTVGRDIVYDTVLNADGVVQSMRTQKIDLGGPGQLQVLAGRHIRLGSSAGIRTVGNTLNLGLPASGADINILAGSVSPEGLHDFILKYAENPAYQARLAGLLVKPKQEQLDAALSVLFDEIKLSAGAAAAAPESQRTALYQRGFDAINTLFPGEDYQGDLALVFSQIKTLADGGITLAVPGGKVDVGLAGRSGGVAKTAEELGIVVQQTGNLNAYSKGDFNVNQSRVFTMGGGDIAVWSSQGNIDAGKGSKAAIAAPPPITRVDNKGNIVTIFPPIVSGSGIQAINPQDKSRRQGNVYLAAPSGIVDAGEAGISGGQVIIAATAVVGASNIQASGGTVGVPTAVAAPVVPTGADSAATGASKSATQTTNADRDKDDSAAGEKRKASISILSADVVGYGQCSVGDVKDGKTGCGG